MKTSMKIFLTGLLLLVFQWVMAQDTLRVDQMLRVKKGEELKIQAGTIVVMKPGSRIWVEGGIKIQGTKDNPVLFISENSSDPGTGIVINGLDAQSSVEINHTIFSGLIQPIRFEPFWSRREVLLEGLTIRGSDYNEAIIFVANPMNDQSKNEISFKLKNSEFFNNAAGVIIEDAGASGIKHELNNLSFYENQINGSDITLGVLHLDLASPYFSKNLRIGNLAFNRNNAGSNLIGLSVSGSGDSVEVENLYTPNKERPVFDYFSDPRIPLVKTELKSLNEWPENTCFVYDIRHRKNFIWMSSGRACHASYLLDSNGNNLTFTQEYKNDSLQIGYTEGLAKKLVFGNNLIVAIPDLEKEADTSSGQKGKEYAPIVIFDSTLTAKPLPLFKPSYEGGLWGGLAFYVGDIKHKFGIPGCYEWSGGIFLQYNKSKKISFRSTYYRTNIGMHDPTAPLMIWQGAPFYVKENGVIKERTSWDINFKTKMYILDFDALVYLVDNHPFSRSKPRVIDNLIPAIGMGMGIMKFDPYKCVVYNTNKDTAVFIPLRPLGTEGQNFLSNKKIYGDIAVNINLSFQLAYIYKGFRIRYELKAVMSLSDYLDDYGQGYAYGADYDKWVSTQAGTIDLPIDKTTGRQVTLDQAFPRYDSKIKRTTNLLPDMFFQNHFGISYDISGLMRK